MICAYPDQTTVSLFAGRIPRRQVLNKTQHAGSVADVPLPFLAAIAAELRKVGDFSEPAALRTARRLLEEAFGAFDDAPTTTSPESIMELAS